MFQPSLWESTFSLIWEMHVDLNFVSKFEANNGEKIEQQHMYFEIYALEDHKLLKLCVGKCTW